MNSPTQEPWSIAKLLRWTTEDFERRGLESPRLDAELLLSHALGVDRLRLILDGARPLRQEELSSFRELIKRRRELEPVAYIVGRREFYGTSFVVDRRVLIPRPDTETLVDVALARTRPRHMCGRMLDLCTGSGCVAIVFSKERPTWRVSASDISEEALAVALENALRHGALRQVRLLRSDLFEAMPRDAKFELITANPPYIPSGELAGLSADIRDFEPQSAIDGGVDGLAVLERLVSEAVPRLSPGGVLAVEVGHDQAARVEALFEARGLVGIERRRDYGGHERVVSGVSPEAHPGPP